MARVVFFGSPEFAVPSLKALAESQFRPELVVTQPDRPSGRGRALCPTPVKEYAGSIRIPVRVIESLRNDEAVEALKSISPDFFIVVAFGLIFPANVLEIPSKECINLHASLLPAYRGASPINAAVVNGEAFTGVSSMRMTERLDAGPVFMQEILPVDPMETAGDLSSRLAEAGAGLLLRTVRGVDAGELEAVDQPAAGVSFAPRLRKSDGEIRWGGDALSVHNHIRGMNPWPGSYSHLNGDYVKILESRPVDLISRTAKAGEILDVGGSGIIVATSPGAVALTALQAGGRKPLGAAEFARGFPVARGDYFRGGTG